MSRAGSHSLPGALTSDGGAGSHRGAALLPLVPSDRGPQTISAVWRAFGKALGTNKSLTSGYHPEYNGQVEPANQLVEETLRCVVAKQPTQWSTQLAWVEYAINSLRSAATGCSPFEVSLGYQPPLFPEEEVDLAVPSVQAHIRRWRRARDALQKAQSSAKRYADRRRRPGPRYQVGQRVWLSARNIPLKTTSRKIAPRFIGPYTINRIVNRSAVCLTLPSHMRINPTFHVSQVQPVKESVLNPPTRPPPPARLIDGRRPLRCSGCWILG
ncbi:hypothetical protein AOLI_G00247250 [Acnodon oligacanthus]